MSYYPCRHCGVVVVRNCVKYVAGEPFVACFECKKKNNIKRNYKRFLKKIKKR